MYIFISLCRHTHIYIDIQLYIYIYIYQTPDTQVQEREARMATSGTRSKSPKVHPNLASLPKPKGLGRGFKA